MSRVSPLMGRKFSPIRLKKHREATARRKAEGFYDSPTWRKYDPRTKLLTLVCARPGCENEFRFLLSPRFSPDKRRYCSHSCQVLHNHEMRTRCPSDFETLNGLYTTRGMTTKEIGKLYGVDGSTVLCALIKVGIPRRKAGSRPKELRCKAQIGL